MELLGSRKRPRTDTANFTTPSPLLKSSPTSVHNVLSRSGSPELSLPRQRLSFHLEKYETRNPHVDFQHVQFTKRYFDDFFAALLQSTFQKYIESDDKLPGNAAYRHWECICERAGLKLPTQPISNTYKSTADHMNNRCTLVLEESRFTLTRCISTLHHGSRKNNQHITMLLQRVSSKNTSKGVAVVLRKEDGYFKPDELDLFLQGAVVEFCSNPGGKGELNERELGCVISTNRETIAKTRQIEVVVYSQESFGNCFCLRPGNEEELRTYVTPVCDSLIDYMRQYAALTCEKSLKVKFFGVILGTQFPYNRTLNSSTRGKSVQGLKEVAAVLPYNTRKLNERQEEAAKVFLDAPERSLVLVQGPPGTGKSTLLVSVICRFVTRSSEEDHGCGTRLMVCAPTNKAVLVLVQRFLEAWCSSKRDLRVILLGDRESLGAAKENRIGSIYLYTWLNCVLSEVEIIRTMLDDDDIQNACTVSRRLRSFVHSRLTELSMENFDLLCDESTANPKHAVQLREQLKKLTPSTVSKQLMDTAEIIFTTLSSSRGTAAMNTRPIDALIVDEAAAATEPMLYCPFHLGPKKMFVVGDPLQLPATVSSPQACRLGLTISLHERLLKLVKSAHYTMLDTQYRMVKEISQFPSVNFYKGQLKNGVNVLDKDYGSTMRLTPCRRPNIIVNVQGQVQHHNESLRNLAEASLVVQTVEGLHLGSGARSNWDSCDQIRVISFYCAQVSLIKQQLNRKGLKNVFVGTVDTSQGSEADVVIISFVRGGDGALGFIDDRRINVALTRARRQLICVGNFSGMSSNCRSETTLSKLAHDSFERCDVAVQHCEADSSWLEESCVKPAPLISQEEDC